MEKTAYYLEHDTEREKIAGAGYKKTINRYTYDRKLKELIDWVREDEH